MPFTAPTQWSHLEVPTSAKMDIYGSNLTFLAGALLGANMPSGYIDEGEGMFALISHHRRFLVYKDEESDAQIVSRQNTEDTFSLPEAKSGVGIIDLDDQVPWMVDGLIYKVLGCLYAIETNMV